MVGVFYLWPIMSASYFLLLHQEWWPWRCWINDPTPLTFCKCLDPDDRSLIRKMMNVAVKKAIPKTIWNDREKAVPVYVKKLVLSSSSMESCFMVGVFYLWPIMSASYFLLLHQEWWPWRCWILLLVIILSFLFTSN
jgi:hypothetical protein